MPLVGQTHEKGAVLSDLLIYEIHREYSREPVTVAAGDALPLGSVLIQGEDGAFAPYNGTGIPEAVLITDIPAKGTMGTAVVRGAVLNASALQWGASVTEEQKTSAIALLKDYGLVARS